MKRILTYAEAINEGITIAMQREPGMLCFGLGMDDPKRIFGTTVGLAEAFGRERVFDIPTSEAGMTGIAIGAALDGTPCLMTHQRLDFFILALDQLVNNAAKWQYMFGGQSASVRLVIRLILGRGWGQGPTHSQSLQSWFAHIPGLKVVMPAFPADAKGLVLSGMADGSPVVCLEHRWLHNVQGPVPEGDARVAIGTAAVVSPGTDVTIVAMSYMTIEAHHAAQFLKGAGISVELIDLRSIRPLDWGTVLGSVRKTGRLLAVDTSHAMCSVASEIVATAACECFAELKSAPMRLTLPDHPSPTSPALAEKFYPRAEDIVAAVGRLLDVRLDGSPLAAARRWPHDVPGDWFKGPF